MPAIDAYGVLHQWSIEAGHATTWQQRLRSAEAGIAEMMRRAFSPA